MFRMTLVSLLAITVAVVGLVPTAAAQEELTPSTSILKSALEKAAELEAQPIPVARGRSTMRTALGLTLAGAGAAWLATPVSPTSASVLAAPALQGRPGEPMAVGVIVPGTGNPAPSGPGTPATPLVPAQPAQGATALQSGSVPLGAPQIGVQTPARSWAARGAALGMLGVGMLFSTIWSDVLIAGDLAIGPTHGGAQVGASIGF